MADEEDQARMANAAKDVAAIKGLTLWRRYMEAAMTDAIADPNGSVAFKLRTKPLNKRERLAAWMKDKRRDFGIWIGGLDDYNY